ncbi:bifunctional nicotinamidase/pyrazinamidase [Zhengella sp. ZM62]|uniref:bifunctional nicotinamidase/pyrazinamidase n=1 Tax=Zhengella sedimenti TaxID=3390035 RepID=UPI0039765DE2
MPDTALLMIDIQNDFCPGGALAVGDGDAVVPVVNALQDRFGVRVLTQDWHPADHASFAANHEGKEPFSMTTMPYGPQVLWPVHCVQGSEGAAFHSDLKTDTADLIIRKGFRAAIDSYSAFYENDKTTRTGLSGYLRDRGVSHVVLTGLATDFCVYYSAIDAVRDGFSATLVTDACRAIDMDGSLAAAMDDMRAKGVRITNSGEL